MSTDDATEEAIGVLQQLGLKEYEARCFVGLSRLSSGTAKRLSEVTDVPRTRIYDAIRVLEGRGLVEVQHSSPQQFQAVPLEVAIETLHDQYDARIERLASALHQTESVESGEGDDGREVWAMSGRDAITNRVRHLVGEATSEVVLIIGDESLLTEDVVECLNGVDEGVHVLVGTPNEPLESRLRAAVPSAETVTSGLEWLRGEGDDDATIGRLLLVDRSSLLVSTVEPDAREEHAVFGGGAGNGFVALSRRLLARGTIPSRDPNG